MINANVSVIPFRLRLCVCVIWYGLLKMPFVWFSWWYIYMLIKWIIDLTHPLVIIKHLIWGQGLLVCPNKLTNTFYPTTSSLFCNRYYHHPSVSVMSFIYKLHDYIPSFLPYKHLKNASRCLMIYSYIDGRRATTSIIYNIVFLKNSKLTRFPKFHAIKKTMKWYYLHPWEIKHF